MTTSIYSSVEVRCWASDFDYKQYVEYCTQKHYKPLVEKAFNKLCEAMYIDMEEEFLRLGVENEN